MTTVINLGLCGGRIGGIFITGIFGNFYTKRGGFLTFKTGIPVGLALDHLHLQRHMGVNNLPRVATMTLLKQY